MLPCAEIARRSPGAYLTAVGFRPKIDLQLIKLYSSPGRGHNSRDKINGKNNARNRERRSTLRVPFFSFCVWMSKAKSLIGYLVEYLGSWSNFTD